MLSRLANDALERDEEMHRGLYPPVEASMFFADVGMRQFTMSETVVECVSGPDVAFTVTVYARGG
jgi:hypothetical protein